MGDDLDIEDANALAQYLRTTRRVSPNEPLDIRVLAGGVSNRTVLVHRVGADSWVLKQALPKLRVAVDWFSDVRRIEREADGLRHLPSLAPDGTITPPIFEDREHHLLAMAAVPEPHENWKRMLLEGGLNADHVRQFAMLLATIHRRASERAGELRPIFSDRSFFESLRIEPYYQYTAAQVPKAASFIGDLVASTRSRLLTLVHGDYSPKNVLVHEDRLVLLDHEVIHWGDPAFDLGFALTHLLSKAHHLSKHRTSFGEQALAFWKIYRQTLGDVPWSDDLEVHAVRHTLGCLLARVAGRSPLEYLRESERKRQRELAVFFMQAPPTNMFDFVSRFILGL